MNTLSIFIYGASFLLFIFLSAQSGYLFFFALAGRLVSLKTYKHASYTGRFVIYLFCDKEDDITDAINAVASLCYPAEKKHIVVITHSLPAGIALDRQNVSVQFVACNHALHFKTKALKNALQQTEGNFDYALLLTAKDICTKGYLYRMNDAFQSGFGVVQGQHIIKNTGSVLALLDAISEGVNTHIFCKSHQLMGLSSSITGSGTGIRYPLLKGILPILSDTADLNKEAEFHLLRKHIHFGYAPKACLYEERNHRHGEAHQKYNRWAAGKSRCFKAYLSDGITELGKGNVDFMDKVFQNILLPRVLLLGITPLLVLLSFLNLPVLATGYWMALWTVTYAAILMSMPAKYVTNRFLQAVFFLPASFLNMVRLFLKPKKKSRNAYSYAS